MQNSIKIAFLGTGLMGGHMAANLAKSGHQVSVWNRTPDTQGMGIAVSGGCSPSENVETAVQGAAFIFVCVSDINALNSVFASTTIQALDPGSLVVDCSTVGPRGVQDLALRLAQQGIRFVDAPVTGGDIGAQNGSLTFMAGGSLHDVEDVTPLLLAMGKKVIYAGDVGRGQALKLINQLLCAENLLAVAEAFDAAKALGLQPEVVIEACSAGAAGSWQLTNLGPKIVVGDDKPGFRVVHMSKDLNLLREELGSQADRLMCFPLVAQAFDVLQEPQFNQGQRGTQTLSLNIKEIRNVIVCEPIYSGSE